MGFEWFLKPIGVYAGGLTGLAQLIREILLLFKVDLSVGLLIFILNVPIVLVGFRFVSKRFAIYSIICIVIQSVLTSGIFPFVDFIVNSGENVDYLLCSIIGAIVTGFACGLALRFGTSTGGIDILAQAATLRDSKVSIGMITMISNVFNWLHRWWNSSKRIWLSSCIHLLELFLTSITVDKIHTAYSLFSLNVISDKSTEITDIILKRIKSWLYNN
ncbi:MAG: YitT family protein [Clostridium sp.]|nr:MAG: YitT family protein [Clostridium sp.]